MKKVLVFGGSFDPVHNGHYYILKRAKEFINASRCVVLPCLSPRWKSPRLDAKHRLNMLKIMFKNDLDIEISSIELESKAKVNYTYDTIKKMIKEDEQIYLLIGADNINLLHKWYKIDSLCKLVKFVGYNRSGNPLNMENIKKYNIEIIEDSLIDISSTEIRNLKALNTKKEILDYIAQNDLYYIKTIKSYISEKRFIHSQSVANLAYDIALKHNLNPYKAYAAGLLHDIAKELDKDKALSLMNEYYKDHINDSRVTYHQYLAIHVLHEELNINDEELDEAIMYHCTGRANMSVLAKLIYSVDKIEPTRGYDSSNMIQALYKDINEGFKLVLKENKKYLIDKLGVIDNKLSNECFKYYLKEEN